MGRGRRLAGITVTIASATAIAWFTLGLGDAGLPAVTGRDYLLTDLVLNTLLFIPLGVGLALLGVRRRDTIISGTLASAVIELSQWGWIPGRTGSFLDVLTNGAGTALGSLLVTAWDDRARWHRVAGIPLAAVLVAAWLAGGLLVVPSSPRGAPWYGFWAHEFSGTTLFPGQVLSLSVQGVAVPDGRFADGGILRERLARSDTIRLETDIVTGGVVGGRAQLSAVSAGHEELASLWQTGTSVLARQRLRLSDLTVRTLWLRMDRALSPSAGDTTRLILEATRRALELRVGHGGAWKVSRVRLGPEIFWTGFLPFEYVAGRGGPPWPVMGAALVFLALGLLIAPHRGAAIAALAITLLIGPAIGGTALPEAETMLAAVAAFGAGWWLSRRLVLAPSNRAGE